MRSILTGMEELFERGGTRKDIVLLVTGGLSVALSFLEERLHFRVFPFDAAWFAIVLCGLPIILKAIAGLGLRGDIKADVLVSLALIASVCIGEEFAAGEVAFIMQIGSFLEDRTVARAQKGIERLVSLTPQAARRITETGQEFVPVDEIRVGDMIRVLAGETVPVDGVIVSGRTTIDQSVMTGEPIPADKAEGDEVSSGTVNQFGTFDMRAERVGEDSSIQRMIRLVKSADAGKAKIVRLADRWATWIVAGALTAALVTWIVTGEILRAVTVLVVFCPCALVLATPTAVMAAIGNAAKHGFLVREGDALERLAGVTHITFDKTGTLTLGTPEVTEVRSVSAHSEEEIRLLAVSAEMLSEHPLGKAVVKSFGADAPEPEEFTLLPGEGVRAVVGGRTVLAGRRGLIERCGVLFPFDRADAYIAGGGTVIYIAEEGDAAGFLVLADTVRPEAGETVAGVKSLGISPVLLTGDHADAAGAVADGIGITEIRAERLPGEKLDEIGKLQESGSRVCMVGDGINDAPSLRKADVGIAMGGVGSDIAVEAADIVLVDDEIGGLPHLLLLAKRMMTTIRFNLVFSLGLNFLAIILAITGLLGPVVGALVHNLGSVLVIINSAFLLKWRKASRRTGE